MTNKTAAQAPGESAPQVVGMVIVGGYLFVVMVFLFWMMLDSWGRQFTLAHLFFPNTKWLNYPSFRMMSYACIGGGFGGVLNGFLTLLLAGNSGRFSLRSLLRYLALPWVGTIAGIFVQVIVRAFYLMGGSDFKGATGESILMVAGAGVIGFLVYDLLLGAAALTQKISAAAPRPPAGT